MEIPENARTALARLEAAGYEAYLVGGCVRDALLGLTPLDWDLCTSARPEETEAVFSGFRLVETGLRHGTVTVLTDGGALEITTFRADGVYSDARRPDAVRFVSSLREDLARRDFTCNAMAYGTRTGLVDLFGGADDLRRRLLRCVGEPDARFREDALRLLRALRFASRLGFGIEPRTAAALHADRELLRAVSAERVFAELKGILTGADAGRVLREFADVLFVALPELEPLRGYEQGLPDHRWDAWEHTLRAVDAAPRDPVLRLALLLHDAGKPDTRTAERDGRVRYPGHAARSRELAAAALARLRCDNATRDAVLALIENHSGEPPRTLADARRELAALGQEGARRLAAVRAADAAGHGTEGGARKLAEDRRGAALTEQAIAEGGCLSLGDLAVNGDDLLALGVPRGPAVGETLRALLDAVLAGETPNRREPLLALARDRRGAG